MVIPGRKRHKVVAFIVFSILVFFFCLTDMAQADVSGNISQAFKNGRSADLCKYLNNTVDVVLNGEVKAGSKTDASGALSDFFSKNPPKDFDVLHFGASKGNDRFLVGEYKSTTKTFRVNMKLSQTGSGILLVDTIELNEE